MKRPATITASLFSASPITCRFICMVILLLLLASVDSSAQSEDRDNPTRLTSNEISGLIDSESKGSVYYYTFIANPGEVSITLSVQSDPPVATYGSSLKSVSFALYDRNAEAITSKSVATYYGGGTGQAVARVNVTRRQPVVLGINIPEGVFNSGTGKYRVRISGTVEFGQSGATALSGDKMDSLECLPKQGTLIVKMKDGSKKIVDLSEAETVTIVP